MLRRRIWGIPVAGKYLRRSELNNIGQQPRAGWRGVQYRNGRNSGVSNIHSDASIGEGFLRVRELEGRSPMKYSFCTPITIRARFGMDAIILFKCSKR